MNIFWLKSGGAKAPPAPPGSAVPGRISFVRNNFSFAHENKYNGEKIRCCIDLSENSFKDLRKRITTENPKCIIINVFFNIVFHWDNPDTYLNSLKIWNINCINNYEDEWELPQSSIMISMKSPGPFSFLCVFTFYQHCIGPGSDTNSFSLWQSYPSSFLKNDKSPVSFRLELDCSTSSISSNCIAKPMATIQPMNAAKDKVFIFASSLDYRKRSSVSYICTRRIFKGAGQRSNRIAPKMTLPLKLSQYRSKL